MLNENIRSLRKQKGFSQETLAQELNVVRQTVSKWEKGYSVPDAVMLERLAELFGVTVGELLGKEQPSPAEKTDLEHIAEQLTILNGLYAREMERRQKVRKIAATVSLCLLVLLPLCIIGATVSCRCVTHLAPMFGDISDVQTKPVESDMYTQKDIAEAMEVTKEYFFREFEGCTLTALYYAGDEVSARETESNGCETLVLLSSFDVDSSGGDGSLNANSTYDNWQWMLTRDADGNWQHHDHGYC